MRIPRIYTPQALEGDEVELDPAAAHHVLKVLRMDAGRALIVFNGDGREFPAEILQRDRHNARIRLGEPVTPGNESPLHTHLGIALSRGERFEFVLQKATELGASAITPLFTERCEVKLNAERLEKKRQSWEKILIAACEQCGRNVLPVLHTPAALKDWLPEADGDLKCVLHHRDTRSLDDVDRPSRCTLLIGPEGGLSDDEIQSAQQHGFQALTLGPRVLRTETAPLVALSLLQYKFGDI